MAAAAGAELVFVVDVSSFTKNGFIGTTTYGGKEVDIQFDDGGDGVFLTSAMAERLRVRKGSPLDIIMESDKSQVAKAKVGGVRKTIRISDPKVYYAVGKEGGAILRVRKA